MVHLQDARRYVCDPENILTQQARDSADSYLYRLDKQCGIESVVVIVGHVKDGDAFRMCQDIFDKYGVGDKKTRRGIVITIAVDDRKYFIEPGYDYLSVRPDPSDKRKRDKSARGFYFDVQIPQNQYELKHPE